MPLTRTRRRCCCCLCAFVVQALTQVEQRVSGLEGDLAALGVREAGAPAANGGYGFGYSSSNARLVGP
jgi:hypothetical protein